MINVESLYDEVGGKPFWREWTWTNSWWQLSLCSFVPAPIFTFLTLFYYRFFAKLSLLFHPWKRISLPFIMFLKCQRHNGPDARVGCCYQSNFFRSYHNHKFLHKSISKFSIRFGQYFKIEGQMRFWSWSLVSILLLMLGPHSKDEIWSRFIKNLWYDLKKLLW